jgi:hypothetical protein
MKIYRLDKGIVLIGKAWEIRMKLKEYHRTYATVSEWIHDEKTLKQSSKVSKQ